jgi:arylsulfatase A-like enzyme
MKYTPRPLFRHRFVPASCALPRGKRLAAPADSFPLPALVRLWVWVILALALPAVAADLALPTVPKKPNILFLLADDLRPDGIGALGNPFVKTPNLDKLVERGLAFRHAYVFGAHIGSVCVPSRTMIYTGCQVFNHKGYGNGQTTTFPQALKAAGYATIRSGKFGANPNDLCKTFDVHLNGYNSENNASNIIAFIHEHAGKQPLFLHMASNEPHDPQFAPPEFYSLYKPEDMPIPPNFRAQHPFDNGEMIIRDEQTLPWPRTRADLAGKLARYYASITYWDEHVGRIIQTLKETGEFEKTIIIIAGDNGLSLGEQGLLGKQNVYEFGGMHVPLVFVGPGIPKGKTDAFAYLMDIFPTVCELTGTAIPAGIDAKSLAPIIAGKSAKVRDYAFTSYTDAQRAIRDQRWKLIRYPKINFSQLFDLQNDPHELNNLADRPAQAGKLKQMMALLQQAQQQYGDTAPLTSEHSLDAKWSPPVKTAAAKTERL